MNKKLKKNTYKVKKLNLHPSVFAKWTESGSDKNYFVEFWEFIKKIKDIRFSTLEYAFWKGFFSFFLYIHYFLNNVKLL